MTTLKKDRWNLCNNVQTASIRKKSSENTPTLETVSPIQPLLPMLSSLSSDPLIIE